MTVNNSILKTLDPNISLVMSSTDNKEIHRFFSKIVGSNKIYDMDDTEYMHRPVHIIVCLNKTEQIDKVLKMAFYLHVPILIIDTKPKPNFITAQKTIPPKITHAQIATNDMIAKSWNIDSYHDIIDMDITNPECINKWKNLLNDLALQTFHFYTDKETESDYEEQKYSFNIQ